MWDLRWKKWHWNRPVCEYFDFPPSDHPTSAPFSWSQTCGIWRRVTFLKVCDVLSGPSSVLFVDCCMVTKWLLPFEASVLLYEWTKRNVQEDFDLHEHRCEQLTHCTQHLHFYLQSCFQQNDIRTKPGNTPKEWRSFGNREASRNEGAFFVLTFKRALI